jgi:hypothetical protein
VAGSLLGGCGTLSPVVSREALERDTRLRDAAASVVRLQYGRESASGILIDASTVLTAGHAAPPAPRAGTHRFNDGRTVPVTLTPYGRVSGEDRRLTTLDEGADTSAFNDWALVRIGRPLDSRSRRLAPPTAEPVVGERAWVVGFPVEYMGPHSTYAPEPVVFVGRVSAVVPPSGARSAGFVDVRLDGPVRALPGLSGGAVLVERAGSFRLAGVVSKASWGITSPAVSATRVPRAVGEKLGAPAYARVPSPYAHASHTP